MKEIIKDARRRTKERNEMDFCSKLAFFAGIVALVALLLWLGVIVDTLSELIMIA